MASWETHSQNDAGEESSWEASPERELAGGGGGGRVVKAAQTPSSVLTSLSVVRHSTIGGSFQRGTGFATPLIITTGDCFPTQGANEDTRPRGLTFSLLLSLQTNLRGVALPRSLYSRGD